MERRNFLFSLIGMASIGTVIAEEAMPQKIVDPYLWRDPSKCQTFSIRLKDWHTHPDGSRSLGCVLSYCTGWGDVFEYIQREKIDIHNVTLLKRIS